MDYAASAVALDLIVCKNDASHGLIRVEINELAIQIVLFHRSVLEGTFNEFIV